MTGRAKNVANRAGAGSVSSTLIRSLLAYCEAIHLHVDSLLLAAGISESDLCDIDGRIEEEKYDLLLAACVSQSRDPHFGLHLGSKLSLHQLGVLGYLLMNASTLGTALGIYERFQQTLGESVVMKLSRHAQRAELRFFSIGGLHSSSHRIESVISALRVAALELTSRTLPLLKVELAHPLAEPKHHYWEHLGLIPSLGNEYLVVLDAASLSLPVINPIPELAILLEEKLSKQQTMTDHMLGTRVKQEIIRQISQSESVSLTAISRRLNMSTRAMQARLESEQTTYRAILRQACTDFALRFLRDGRPIAEIAFGLGFAEPAAFQRAFKRWTGTTPGRARNSLR